MADNDEDTEPSGAEKLFGVLAPALVHVTDAVLLLTSGDGRSCHRRSAA